MAGVHVAEVAVAFGSVTGSYATLLSPGTNPDTGQVYPWKFLDVRNLTNVTLRYSFDGGTTLAFTLAPGEALVMDDGEMPVGILSMRNDGTAPASGSTYAAGRI